MASQYIKFLDNFLITQMQKYGVHLLRIALGIVFVWFGALKVFGVSPVLHLIQSTYTFLPEPAFLIVLGIWEIIIGIGLIFKIFFRATLLLLWMQMFGTLTAPLLEPSIFFNGNVFLLTMEGEFVVKNFVLLAASLAIGGYELKENEKV